VDYDSIAVQLLGGLDPAGSFRQTCAATGCTTQSLITGVQSGLPILQSWVTVGWFFLPRPEPAYIQSSNIKDRWFITCITTGLGR
jgi:hypothetical protein